MYYIPGKKYESLYLIFCYYGRTTRSGILSYFYVCLLCNHNSIVISNIWIFKTEMIVVNKVNRDVGIEEIFKTMTAVA
jgi:hypothetical protein